VKKHESRHGGLWISSVSHYMAIQKVEGGVKGIDEALIYLYKDYIPKNGLCVAMPIDFEKYCNVQDHESCPDEIEIWVPIEHS